MYVCLIIDSNNTNTTGNIINNHCNRNNYNNNNHDNKKILIKAISIFIGRLKNLRKIIIPGA